MAQENYDQVKEDVKSQRVIDGDCMVDAGYSSIYINNTPTIISFNQDSMQYGKADEGGRLVTGQLAQQALGESIRVVAK